LTVATTPGSQLAMVAGSTLMSELDVAGIA